MPKVSSLVPRVLASLALVTVLGSATWAQQPPTVRIRGTIESADGPVLTVKSREGADMKVRVTDNVVVVGIAKSALSEIKPGSYIGVSATVALVMVLLGLRSQGRKPSAAPRWVSGKI